MAHLIKIGNSQGIRIPKILIEQAQLEGKELEFEVLGEGLLVLPSRKPRTGWKEAIEETLAAQGAEMADAEWLDATLTDDETLEW
ncbi:MAG: AbrB/MazE/SpoVT family DNA-binding domain-containing protein [Candidatus Hydrogenedentes bacterium]|nr:AbrB/MazE/SpoVT family DNA-binding domain-containing protein [Candidatus Hydrogenedentota bacterium]